MLIFAIGLQANAGSNAKNCAALFSNVKPSARITTGAQFLHQKNQTLYTSRPVSLVAQRTQNRTAKHPDQRIDNWLKYLEQTSKKASEDPVMLTRLKKSYYKLHVIKQEEVPQSYYDLQVRLARERGHGNIEITDSRKAQLSEVLIKDQQKSLDSWIEYLVSPDSSSYPMWAKFWAFQGMTKLSKFDKETQSFSNRSKGTTTPFIELNREAFAYVIDAVAKKLNKSSLEQISDPKFLSLLEGFNFGKLYARALVISKSGPSEKQLRITEGLWITYPKGSDATLLSRSLEGKNTGWCTAAEGTAKSQVAKGDFHVYYSLDYNGKPTTPRVAIRMEDSKIAEIRGIGKAQNLDSHISSSNVLKEKMKEFGAEGKKYLKKEKDMARLTSIETKNKQNLPLTKTDIRFLYQIDNVIEGFGYSKDPRLKEIQESRNQKKDLAFLMDAKESEIALTFEEAILPHTKYALNMILIDAILNKKPDTVKVVDKVINLNAQTAHSESIPLHIASQLAPLEVVKKILDRGVDVNIKSDNGSTALHPAASLGRIEIVKLLLERGADIHAVSEPNKNTALSLAISQGHKEVVQLLLEKGADIESTGMHSVSMLQLAIASKKSEIAILLIDKGANLKSIEGEQTPLHLAIKINNNTDLVLKILEKGADINAVDKNGISPLGLAIRSSEGTAVASILIGKGANIHVKEKDGTSLLELAIRTKKIDIAILLIDKGASIKYTNPRGVTPLHLAAETGNADLVLKLLEKGANINAKDVNGSSALSNAVEKNENKIALLLLDKGANPNTTMSSNHIAAFKTVFGSTLFDGKTAVALKFIEKGVDINTRLSTGGTYLSLAARNSGEVALKLIEKGIDVHVKDENSNSALSEAFHARNISDALITKLLEKGLNINEKNLSGRTLLLQSMHDSSKETALRLIEKGADVNAKDPQGNTPLIYASKNGDITLVRKLLEKGADINAKTNTGTTALSSTRYQEIHDLLKQHGAKE